MECWLATLNESSATVSHALEQVTAARIGVICECFNWSSLLACKAVTVQLSICFPISLSRIHLAASLYLCPRRLLSRHSVRTSWEFSLEQVGIDISASCTYESNSLDVNTAKHVRSLRKVQEYRWRSLCVVCGLLAMFRDRKSLFWVLPISVLGIHKYRQVSSCHALFFDRKKKTLECWLATQTHLLRQCHMLCNK